MPSSPTTGRRRHELAPQALAVDPNLDGGGKAMTFKRELMSHRGFLVSLGLRMTKSRQDAEDLAHDVMIKALENEESFTPGTNMRAWLRRILTNHFLSGRVRDAMRRRLISATKDASVSWAGDFPPADKVLLGSQIREAVKSLPAPYGDAVMKVDIEGLKYKEAADAFCIPMGTVMSRLHRGRKILASSLRKAA